MGKRNEEERFNKTLSVFDAIGNAIWDERHPGCFTDDQEERFGEASYRSSDASGELSLLETLFGDNAEGEKPYYKVSSTLGTPYPKCPNCDADLSEGHFNFCPNCGQKLDWNGTKEPK